MERIPEPELMDDDAQARAYAEADFEAPHSSFVDMFRERFADLGVDGVVLDLGCGPADIALRFARAFPKARVHGIDGAPAMLRYGHQAVAAAGLGARVELFEGYLPHAGLPRSGYHVVISNSLLHHLRRPGVLWETVRAAALPGAAVFVMDLMRPPGRAAAEALVDEHAAGEPPVLRHDFLHSLLAAYRPEEVRAQLADAGLGDALRVEAVSDRHLVAWGRVPG